MKTSDFDFDVPQELIAQTPAEMRDHARLMVVDRSTQQLSHKKFYDIIEYLLPDDLLVLNNTKVIPANLIGRKVDGTAKIEVLLVKRRISPSAKIIENLERWECLVKPGKRLKIGSGIIFGEGELVATVQEKIESGEQVLEFVGDLGRYMKKSGEIPLPPYIKASQELAGRYQTVYAKNEGASAAPTAGLHFTPELLKSAERKGVKIAYVTLHTGLATFKPVYAEVVEEHKMYFEEIEVPAETFKAIKAAKRVIAVGTTSVRTLESVAEMVEEKALKNEAYKGETNLFIYPGYKFKCVDAMISNFHWPRTSLVMLVSAFAQDLGEAAGPQATDFGRRLILNAYQEAVREKYRFFSFGDAMLII